MIDLLLVPVPKTLLSWAQDRPCARLVLSVCSNTAILSCCLLSAEVTDDKCEPRCCSLITLHITSPGPAIPPGQQVRYNSDN